MKFIPGMELSRMLYEEEIKSIMETRFSGVKYAAATIGMTSEVLGLDDKVSMDHNWGPLILIFIGEKDRIRYARKIIRTFRELLPTRFKGFDIKWFNPKNGIDVVDTKDAIIYRFAITTVSNMLLWYGIKSLPPQEMNWLTIPEQFLLEFTSGKVFRDDLGKLTEARNSIKYYPDNVLRFLLMHEWNALGGEFNYIGRTGSRGDRLGMHILASKTAHRLMRIAFMINRSYIPYNKWFGTVFKNLPSVSTLEPILTELITEEKWENVEEKVCEVTSFLLQQQNKLGIIPKITMDAKKVDDGRNHMMYDFWDIGKKIADSIQPPLKSLLDNQMDFRDPRNLIFGNEEAGKKNVLTHRLDKL